MDLWGIQENLWDQALAVLERCGLMVSRLGA